MKNKTNAINLKKQITNTEIYQIVAPVHFEACKTD